MTIGDNIQMFVGFFVEIVPCMLLFALCYVS